ncbi:hypothetical protein SKTS_21650 [Sulfurimicrobium lacus]|uniref:Flagellar hook-length control protein-like C-terminal domain-containing protein n=1 Tax=Sulfurimicrobium lacus TaxID=2715678 RepID=A0A6F8VEY3_9PROT|nr:flagellar hook-length control protein FliK [Sulfurimicrobium lacus]BCB27279.1 hypothetical protein SKTS_21650 [Sulfurimicrobium lacus]
MIQNDVVTQLQMLIKTSAPPLLEVSQQQLELPQLVPGQKLPAFVVANLPNGRFQVLIADKMLDMNLPKNTQPGDTVDLVFVTTKPRLTFVLASDLGNIANSANTASAANAKPQVSLSDTARFLGGLLEKTTQPDATNTAKGMATAVASATPLVSAAPTNTLDFAQALRGALTQSGLFYESHQAQWVTGQIPLTDLLREPQGRLSPAAEAPQTAQGGANPQASVNAQTTAQTQQTVPNPLHLNDMLAAKPLAADQIAHPDTLPLVRQQLEALDSRQVVWQGQVWPGQTMDWKVEERSAREQRGETAMPEWQTSLHMVLPHLGEIAATLTLQPQGIRIQLGARDAASAKLLAEQRIALKQGMETSGLQLVEMKVRHETEG